MLVADRFAQTMSTVGRGGLCLGAIVSTRGLLRSSTLADRTVPTNVNEGARLGQDKLPAWWKLPRPDSSGSPTARSSGTQGGDKVRGLVVTVARALATPVSSWAGTGVEAVLLHPKAMTPAASTAALFLASKGTTLCRSLCQTVGPGPLFPLGPVAAPLGRRHGLQCRLPAVK